MPNDSRLLQQVTRFVDSLAQCRELAITPVEAWHNHLVLQLPYDKRIVGNPETGVIHGGAITTLMDTTSGSVVICALPEFELCPTLDLRVDYMAAASPLLPVLARASCYKITRHILFTRCEAYQVGPDQRETVIANCVATFMRIGKEATPLAYRQQIEGNRGD